MIIKLLPLGALPNQKAVTRNAVHYSNQAGTVKGVFEVSAEQMNALRTAGKPLYFEAKIKNGKVALIKPMPEERW